MSTKLGAKSGIQRVFRISVAAISSLALILSLLLGGGVANAVHADDETGGPAGPSTVSSVLGLPAISSAQRYNLAPASRNVRPASVSQSTSLLADYVSAAVSYSETPAHALILTGAGSSVATVDGSPVRRSGTSPDAAFSYLLHGSGRGDQMIRVEAAGSATAAYDVVVGAKVVYSVRPTSAEYAFGGRQVGMEHYSFTVKSNDISRDGTFRVAFRNTANPGDGAQIAGVWDSAANGSSEAPFGGSVTDPAGALAAGTTVLRSDIFSEPYVIYDFGRDVGGTISVSADNRSGSPRLGLAFSESAQFLTTSSDFSQDPSGVATETHYFQPAAGKTTINDPVIRGGFRYLMVFLNTPGELALSNLTLHFTADPDNTNLREYQGAFLSSDETLNHLWYAGAYTTQLATIASNTGRPYPAQPGPVSNSATVSKGTSFLSDGAKRDRLDWGGDNVVSGPVSLLTTGQGDAVRNSIEWFGDHPFPNGEIPGVYLPAPAGFQAAWGEYAAWWVHNYWTYYLYTGDKSFLNTYYSAMKGNLAWFATQVGSDNLWDVSSSSGGHWGYGESGRETYDNAVYDLALKDAAAAATAEGDLAVSASYLSRAAQTATAVNATLWDDSVGAYRVLPGNSGHPLDGNAMAVVAGIASGDRATRALAFVHKTLGTDKGELAVDTSTGNSVSNVISPFVAYQELLADSALGTAAGNGQALSDLQRTWAHMLTGDTSGTLWETVSPTGGLGLGSYTSMAHGWGTGPTAYLSNQLVGVTPTGGGFATFDVAPHPAAGVSWAQGLIPTPHGSIQAGWHQTDHTLAVAVVAPVGTHYRIVVPSTAGSLSVNGKVLWQGGHPTDPHNTLVTSSGGNLLIDGLSGTSSATTF